MPVRMIYRPDGKAEKPRTRLEITRLLLSLLLGKLVVLGTAYVAYGPNFLFRMSHRWDSAWYLSTAQYGYVNGFAYAFSPMYPSLIRGLTFLTGTYWVSALVIANSVSFVVPYVVYRSFGFRVALLFELFPTFLVFTTVPYSESLTLLFVSLALLFCIGGRVTAASGSLSLAIFGSYSLALTAPSFILALPRLHWRKMITFFALPIVTGVLILLWFRLSSGSFFAFFEAEAINWKVKFATPLSQAAWLVAKGGRSLGFWPFPGFWFTRNLPFVVFYLFGALYLLRVDVHNKVFLCVFSLSVILPLLFVIGGPALSVPRLMLPAIPVFVTYGSIIKGRYVWVVAAASVALAVWVTASQMLYFFA